MKSRETEISTEQLPGSLNFFEVIAKILDGDFFEAAREQLAASEQPNSD
ncbi:MAG: hypothetical protein QOK37_440 [Thermoanaerobaculia bacterium]|nr:hypothetical protein [Thermoanaerobaculia bacterium]